MKEFIWVKCESCGYSNRVFLGVDDLADLIIEADGWTPGEVVEGRQTWICQTCAKGD